MQPGAFAQPGFLKQNTSLGGFARPNALDLSHDLPAGGLGTGRIDINLHDVNKGFTNR